MEIGAFLTKTRLQEFEEICRVGERIGSRFGPDWSKIVSEVAGCSAVWLAHLVWDQGVEGSNPFTPTFFLY